MNVAQESLNYEGETRDLAPDDRIASLFQPDTLLSAQYFDNLRRKMLLEPEKRLMLAILEDGVHCYRDNLNATRGKRKRHFDDAAAWIVATDGDWIFSFENVCETLGLNPQYLRQGLLRWKERRSDKLPAHLPSATAERLVG